MKHTALIALFLLYVYTATAQRNPGIDTSNYYEHYAAGPDSLSGENLTTGWLYEDEVVPVLLEELKNAGYEMVYSKQLFEAAPGQRIVLTAYCRKGNFGFMYVDGHDADPERAHRKQRSMYKKMTGDDCMPFYFTPNGAFRSAHIKTLPKNIFILQENCYWFQYTENPEDNKKLVTKEDILYILRQDIRKHLSQAPGPSK